MRIYDIIIIGGGPAGYTAALYGARAGLDTLIIERMSVGGQMSITDVIDNYPGFNDGIDGIELSFKMQAGSERFGAKTEYAEVLDVDFLGKVKKIITSSGEKFAYTVIIATGANPRLLGVDGEEKFTARGVHYCAHCDGRFYKDKTVIVAGGGNTAVSDALYLSRLAKKVYLVHRRDSLKATKIYVDALEKIDNVESVFSANILRIDGAEKFEGIVVKRPDGENKIIADGLFVSVGRVPATKIFDGKVELDSDGYIIANESTKTNVGGVYAVGDVRTKVLRQVVTAVGDGAVAVHYAEEYINGLEK
ncbi:MAG: thioredoxin-disulfide reductase [Clostridiales bacterium]|nr:thioredoxin-disulfide reductase [Clostridiales bacterium]